MTIARKGATKRAIGASVHGERCAVLAAQHACLHPALDNLPHPCPGLLHSHFIVTSKMKSSEIAVRSEAFRWRSK